MASPGLVRIHRYAALAAGAFVALLGLTGAALVFRDELTATFTPAVRIAPAPAQAGDYQRILAAVRRVDPASASMDIVPAVRGDRAAEVIIHGAERYLFVDPHSGAVVADSDREWLPFATLYEIHRRYMAGEAGESAVGIAGAALAFLALSGLVMWWPRAPKYAFRIRWDGNRTALSFDLHRCAGAAFALFLAVNALSGMAMAFDAASAALVNRILGADAPAIAAAPSIAQPAKPLDEIVAAAERAFPGGRVTRIAIRRAPAPVVVRKRLDSDNETHGMNRIYVDPASATVLQAVPLRSLAPGGAMFDWLYPLHTGKLAGLPYRLLLVIAGLVPAFSLVTGLVLWRSRAKRKSPVPTSNLQRLA